MLRHLSGRTPGFLDATLAFAVAAPFLPETRELLFQIRATTLNRQPGEICFPGGRIEAEETPEQAAKRETMEELLIAGRQIEVIAPLDHIITTNQSRVYPFLVYLSDYTFSYNPDEVDRVFTVPFDYFLTTEPVIQYTNLSTLPEEPRRMAELLGTDAYPWVTFRNRVLFYRYQDKLIWGLTAKIIYHLVELYRGSCD